MHSVAIEKTLGNVKIWVKSGIQGFEKNLLGKVTGKTKVIPKIGKSRRKIKTHGKYAVKLRLAFQAPPTDLDFRATTTIQRIMKKGRSVSDLRAKKVLSPTVRNSLHFFSESFSWDVCGVDCRTI